MKGDKGAPVVLDFENNVIRLRQVCKNEPRYVVTIPMPEWVVERMKEGGDIKFAMIGLRDDEPYLALIAERVVEPYQPSNYMLVVDVNAWGTELEFVIMVIAVSCVKLLSAHNSTQHTSRKHKV
jgi:hypothetical protein